MGYVKEPEGIDFFVNSTQLNEEDRKNWRRIFGIIGSEVGGSALTTAHNVDMVTKNFIKMVAQHDPSIHFELPEGLTLELFNNIHEPQFGCATDLAGGHCALDAGTIKAQLSWRYP